jgi:very-short-patch-repair endonuclease
MEHVDKKLWHTCKICSSKISELAKKYGGDGVYYTAVFREHLKHDHQLIVEDYFSDIIPMCPCGTCDKKCSINIKPASNFKFSMACGRYDGTMKWSKEAKKSRVGNGNPMFGKKPWNKGRKMSTDCCNKMRLATINRIKRGDFKFTDTKPHILFCKLLDKLNVIYEKEKELCNRFYDVFLPDYSIYIEIDGDYWHSNPEKYPNGPINDIQIKIRLIDKIKNDICKDNGVLLLRFWESHIINNEDNIICTLKELLQLKE